MNAQGASPKADSPARAAQSSDAAVPAAGASLKGICPDKIVIQTDWYAPPERAAAYQLIGANGTVDKKKARIRDQSRARASTSRSASAARSSDFSWFLR
jgi:hypothetical protein